MTTSPGAQSAAARRAAQRRTAQEIRTGTYEPGEAGKAYRRRIREIREDEAYALNAARDAAYYNIYGRLHNYIKFREPTVLANVYGGTTPESGTVPGMSLEEAQWTANADTEELRANASEQYTANPWFYH